MFGGAPEISTRAASIPSADVPDISPITRIGDAGFFTIRPLTEDFSPTLSILLLKSLWGSSVFERQSLMKAVSATQREDSRLRAVTNHSSARPVAPEAPT